MYYDNPKCFNLDSARHITTHIDFSAPEGPIISLKYTFKRLCKLIRLNQYDIYILFTAFKTINVLLQIFLSLVFSGVTIAIIVYAVFHFKGSKQLSYNQDSTVNSDDCYGVQQPPLPESMKQNYNRNKVLLIFELEDEGA